MKDEVFTIGGEDAPPRSPPEPHTISHRRKIGAFYTPLNVATILCNWGVRTKDETVLEPCFGGCTFLEALLNRLQSLGQTEPAKQLFGCDIDPLAFKYLDNFGNIAQHRENFVLKDFLSISDADIGEKFDLLIGNPPYIRHSKFDIRQKTAVSEWAERYGIKLNGRASLWAYFILHALNFLKPGGRVAWVLPMSFLTSAYAAQVRDLISERFEKITAITLTERLFIVEGTEEATVILLADGFAKAHERKRISIKCVDTISEMEELIGDGNHDSPDNVNEIPEYQGNGMLPDEAIISFEKFSSENVVELGNLATVQIGLVTGNVPYFIKSQKKWIQLGITSKYLRYILPKTLWVRGISLDFKDQLFHIENNIPCLALNSPQSPRPIAVKAYLDGYGEDAIKKNATFQKRPIWHHFFDERIPDAFLVFMTHLGPRMIINNIDASCTNSVYRVFFKSKLTQAYKKIIAISLNSTYTQFSAELCGQGRGSGALKLEPSHVHRLRIYIPVDKSITEINSTFLEIDELLRSDKFDEARKKADSFIFKGEKRFSKISSILENGLKVGRTRRMRNTEKPI